MNRVFNYFFFFFIIKRKNLIIILEIMRFRILLSLGSPQVENINEEIFF